MKILHNILIISLVLFGISCSEDNYGEHTDINLPVPTVTSVTAEPIVGAEISIKGENYASPNTVSINGISMKIVSESVTEIRAVLPRIFEAAPIVVRNAYGRQSENEDIIKPKYPDASEITVTKWPMKILRGKNLVIEGTNVDLITEITIGTTVIAVNGLNQTPERMAAFVPANLEGTSSTIIVRTILGTTIESGVLDIEDSFAPADPILILDFEDGITHFTKGDVPDVDFTAQINRSGIAPIEGNNFFSLYIQNIPSNWSYLGSIKLTFSPALDLSEFTDPHFSFLLNSDDNICNFQVKTVQSGKVGGSYFANGVTNDSRDKWTLRPTAGQWEWVTANMKKMINENWGGGFDGFDPQGSIEEIELIFKQVNAGYWNGVDTDSGVFVNNLFKLNIDQVMITDGPYTGE